MASFVLVLAMALVSSSSPANASLAERLGFAPGEKVLLVHADDLGSITSANRAASDVLDFGIVQSASLMFPCPAVADAVKMAIARGPDADFGVHVTLNSEWKYDRWGPVAGRAFVPSLVDERGRLQLSLFPLFVFGRLKDVAFEIEAQIQAALKSGLRPTHLDTHMGAVFLRPQWFHAYLNLARQYQLAPMIPHWSEDMKAQLGWAGGLMSWVVPGLLEKAESAGFLTLDYLIPEPSPADDSFQSRRNAYMDIIRNLKPGVTQVIIHPAYSDSEFQTKIMTSNPEQVLRDYEARIFQDPQVRALIENQKVHLIGWRQIRDAYRWDQVSKIEN